MRDLMSVHGINYLLHILIRVVLNIHTNATHIRFQIVTSTHWMRISMHENKFENAMEGTYTMDGNKWKVMIDNASFPASGMNVEITSRQEGNKMYWSGTVKDANG